MRSALVILLACSSPPNATPDGRPPPPAPTVPTSRPAPTRDIAFGHSRACARTADGGVACWTIGAQLGATDITRIPDLDHVRELFMSMDTLLVVRDDGTLWRHDRNTAPKLVQRDVLATDAAAGYACVVDRKGAVTCWGEAGSDLEPTRFPSQLIKNVPPLVEVDVGLFIACGRTSTGDVWCWGWGGGKPLRRIPLRRPATSISARSGHACAILDDATVECWDSPFADPDRLGCHLVKYLRAGPPSYRWEDCPPHPLPGVRNAIAIIPSTHGELLVQSDNGAVMLWDVKPTAIRDVDTLHNLVARNVAGGVELCGRSEVGGVICTRHPPVVPPDALKGPWKVQL